MVLMLARLLAHASPFVRPPAGTFELPAIGESKCSRSKKMTCARVKISIRLIKIGIWSSIHQEFLYIYIYIPVIHKDGGTASHFILSNLTMANMARGHDICHTSRLQFTRNRIDNLEVDGRSIFQTKPCIRYHHCMG